MQRDRAHRNARRAAGLCWDCQSPALPYRTRCERHLEILRTADAKRRRARSLSMIAAGRCSSCGREREEGCDNTLCVACREKSRGLR